MLFYAFGGICTMYGTRLELFARRKGLYIFNPLDVLQLRATVFTSE